MAAPCGDLWPKNPHLTHALESPPALWQLTVRFLAPDDFRLCVSGNCDLREPIEIAPEPDEVGLVPVM